MEKVKKWPSENDEHFVDDGSPYGEDDVSHEDGVSNVQKGKVPV